MPELPQAVSTELPTTRAGLLGLWEGCSTSEKRPLPQAPGPVSDTSALSPPTPNPPKSLPRNNSPHSKATERKPTFLAVTAIFLLEGEGLSLCRASLASGAGQGTIYDTQTKARAF